MAPMGTPHCSTLNVASGLLSRLYGDGFFVSVQCPIDAGDGTEQEPDIAIIRGDARGFCDRLPSTAELVIEVADTSLSAKPSRESTSAPNSPNSGSSTSSSARSRYTVSQSTAPTLSNNLAHAGSRSICPDSGRQFLYPTSCRKLLSRLDSHSLSCRCGACLGGDRHHRLC